jgi:hypothetical protein
MVVMPCKSGVWASDVHNCGASDARLAAGRAQVPGLLRDVLRCPACCGTCCQVTGVLRDVLPDARRAAGRAVLHTHPELRKYSCARRSDSALQNGVREGVVMRCKKGVEREVVMPCKWGVERGSICAAKRG